MGKLAIIGLDGEENDWVRRLLALLRHPDPVTAELTRQAVMYLENTAEYPVGTADGRG